MARVRDLDGNIIDVVVQSELDAPVSARARVIDLGVFHAADLGELVDLRTLIGAPAGSFVQIAVGNTDFVPLDDEYAGVVIQLWDDRSHILEWTGNAKTAAAVIITNYAIPGYVDDGVSPVTLMRVQGEPTEGSIHLYAIVVRPWA